MITVKCYLGRRSVLLELPEVPKVGQAFWFQTIKERETGLIERFEVIDVGYYVAEDKQVQVRCHLDLVDD